jgi:hypothetical protein
VTRVATFVPTELERALATVRSQHTRTGPGTGEISESLIAAVKKRLAEADPDDIPRLAAALLPRELIAAIHLLDDDEVGEKSELVLDLRPRDDLMRTGWRTLLFRYPARRLERLLPRWAGRQTWKAVAKERITADLLMRWFATGRLDQGLARDWERNVDSSDALPDAWLNTLGLGSFDALRNAFWTSILLTGGRRAFLRIGASPLLTVAEASALEVQQAFSAHYLRQFTSSESWDDQVVAWIVQEQGLPREGGVQSAFWRSVQEETREEIRRWQRIRTLRDFLRSFNDPDGRFKFWEPFVKQHSKDVRLVCREAGSSRYVALGIEFDGWGVIEFGPVGNAAYIYPQRAYKRIASQDSSLPRAYKDTVATISGGSSGDGRIVHREGWQLENRSWIESLIRRKGVPSASR